MNETKVMEVLSLIVVQLSQVLNSDSICTWKVLDVMSFIVEHHNSLAYDQLELAHEILADRTGF